MLAPSGSAPPAVAIRDVTLHYFTPERETLALSNVSLEVERGEFIAVVGSSGCGKSTLLSIVSGLLAPSGGDIFIEGRKITAPSPQVGYMFQKDTLLEWRTVLDNVLIGAELLDLDMSVARRRAQELLRRYGLGEFMHSLPHQLSGGMRQRAALARTLVPGARPPAARRAVLGARLSDAARALRRDRRHPGGRAQDRDPRDPRHRRGDQHGRPRRGHEPASRPHQVGAPHQLSEFRTVAARRRSRRANAPSSRAISRPSGTSSTSIRSNRQRGVMSSEAAATPLDRAKAASTPAQPARSPAYERYLRALRRRTRSIQAWQLGLVVGVPDPVGGCATRQLDQSDAHQLSVGGGANLHGDARGWQPGETYLGHLQRDRGRLRRRHGARHGLRGAAVVVDLPLSRARSLHRGAQRDAEDCAGADLLHLARRRRVDLRHGDRGQRLHHDPDAVHRLSGHRSRQDQAGAAVWRLALEGADQDRAAGQRADHDLHPEGQCRPRSGRRGRRRIPGRQGRAWISSSSTAARSFR